jgi:hypothetical protein
MSSEDAPEPEAAPGWRPDPLGHAAFRWWDGTSWTEHVGQGDRHWVDPYEPSEPGHELVRVSEPDPPGPRGVLARRRAKKAASDVDRVRLREAVERAAAGDESSLERLPALVAETRAAWSDRELAKFADQTFLSLAREYLEDDLLTQDEQNRLLGIAATLGLSQDAIRSRHRSTFEDIVIASLNAGRLPKLDAQDAHLMAKAGEVVHGEWPAQLMKEVAVREYRGASSGVSIPLGAGVRFRTSSVRGRSVVVGHELVAEDAGFLAVTSIRSVFVGSKKTVEFRHDKLVGLQQFADGLRLNVSNRQRASLLKIPKADSPLLAGAMITAAGRLRS